MNRYPESKYSNTQNTSIKQQNGAKYTKSEYDDTQKMSMASKLIRVQGEQIREIPAQYVARKCKENEHRKGESNDREIF